MGRRFDYINVDLEIESRGKLDAVIAELGPQFLELWNSRYRGVHHLHYNAGITTTPAKNMAELIRAIAKMSPAAKKQLAAAKRKELNIGVQAGIEPSMWSPAPIDAKTLAACVDYDLSVGFTVYAVRR
jgi:hypothetical protein